MASEKFRQTLRDESQQWRQENLITSAQFQQLADRYQFDRLDQQASNRFTFLLIVLGSILVGLGIITYVAANWQDIPKVFRTLLLFGLFTIANLSGFWLYRTSDKLKQILGQGLLLIGGITLGATMALMAQMYHLSGPLHPLLITWSLGVAVMAYCLRNVPLGVLSALILGWASAIGGIEVYRFVGPNHSSQFSPTFYSVTILNLPTIAGLLYFPLAHWCRSRSLFIISILVGLLGCIPLWNEVSYFSSYFLSSNFLSVALLTFPIAFLWSYPLIGQRQHRDQALQPSTDQSTHQTAKKFQIIARNFSVVTLGFLLYIASFRYSFLLMPSGYSGSTNDQPISNGWMYIIPGIAILGLMGVKQWIQLFRNLRSRNEANIHLVILAMLIVLGSYSILPKISDRPEMIFVLNALLTVLSIGCIRESLETKRRSQFWYGLLVLVVQIASRFLEYETELILKSVILTLCGIGIIVAGIWFEKYAGRSQVSLDASTDLTDSTGD